MEQSFVKLEIEMYILLDKQSLAFRHKHHDKAVLNALCQIEVAHCHVGVYRIDVASRFPDLTELDLRLLYKHTTGHKFEGFSHQHLIEMVLGAARALPESDAGQDAIVQASKIDSKDKGFYRYLKGSVEAQPLNELFTPATLASSPEAAAAQAVQVQAEPTEPDPVPAPAMPLAARPAAPRGGNRTVIFEVADKMWADAGSPKDVQAVLTLRRAIMAELETAHGVKKTTSSTALGEWQKLRLTV